MKKIYISLVVLAIIISSCGFPKIIVREKPQNLVQMGTPAILLTTTADLDVSSNRMTYSETFNTTSLDEIVNYAKPKALSNALIKNNADVIVCVTYDVNIDQKANATTITVTGYPATYVNFRQATAADTMLLLTTPVYNETTGVDSKASYVPYKVTKKK